VSISAARLVGAALCVCVPPFVLAACGGGGNGVTTFSETPTTTSGATIAEEPSPEGPILATGAGYTLYEFVPDTPTKSACVTSACVFLWPPLVVTATPTLGPGLHRSLVSTLRRPDGATQVAYGGHPLYRWNSDTKPGMTTGQALLNEGGYWYVVSPTGKPITTPFTTN
jgi:predicted lipoprotein with Yx(FWY)xxD motif